jgi:hypothetical protein
MHSNVVAPSAAQPSNCPGVDDLALASGQQQQKALCYLRLLESLRPSVIARSDAIETSPRLSEDLARKLAR